MLRELLRGWQYAFIPYFTWLGELKNKDVLRADIIAGVTVALILVPQSMAYAQLAGLPPYYGLYASFLPPMVAAIFGSSRQLATGPVAVVSLMTAATLEPLASSNPEGFLAYAMLLALLVGLFQLSLGLFRLGVLVDFLSHPVVIGFTNAAAIIIGTSQLSKLFGVTVEKAEHHYETVWRVVEAAISHTHMLTLGMAVLSLVIMVGLKRFLPKIPNVLVAVVLTTVLSWVIGFEAKGGAVVGVIPEGLPKFSLPPFDFQLAVQLMTSAIIISLIGFMEAISIAKAMAAESRQRLDPNQELVGQGLSNITASMFNGYPVSGSFSRSAVNFGAGAKTGFSSVVTGIVVGITLLFLTPLLYHLPQATLGAVIIMAVVNLVKFKPIWHAWKVEKHDGIVAIVTFVLTLLFAPHLEKGIEVGVILSLGLFVFRTMRPRIVELAMHEDGTLRDAKLYNLPRSSGVAVIRMDMSLYFANAGYLEEEILELIADRPELEFLILDCKGINAIDATGEEVLRNLSESLSQSGIQLLFAGMKDQVLGPLEASGFVKEHGKVNFFRRVTEAIYYATSKLSNPECTLPLREPPKPESQKNEEAEPKLAEAAGQ